MALYNVQVPARNGDCCGLSTPLKMTLKESRRRKSSWWQNVERGIWFSTLPRRRDGLKSGSTLNPGKWLLKETRWEAWEQKLGTEAQGQTCWNRPRLLCSQLWDDCTKAPCKGKTIRAWFSDGRLWKSKKWFYRNGYVAPKTSEEGNPSAGKTVSSTAHCPLCLEGEKAWGQGLYRSWTVTNDVSSSVIKTGSSWERGLQKMDF